MALLACSESSAVAQECQRRVLSSFIQKRFKDIGLHRVERPFLEMQPASEDAKDDGKLGDGSSSCCCDGYRRSPAEGASVLGRRSVQ